MKQHYNEVCFLLYDIDDDKEKKKDITIQRSHISMFSSEFSSSEEEFRPWGFLGRVKRNLICLLISSCARITGPATAIVFGHVDRDDQAKE